MKINIIAWYKKNYSVLLIVLITLLILDVFIDPSDLIFHLKYFLFGMLFLFWSSKLIYEKINVSKRLLILVTFISFLMPLYALSVGLLNNFLNNTSVGTIVYFNSFFFFTLLLVVVNEKIELTKIFNNSALIIVFITIGLYGVMFFNPNYFIRLYQYFVIDKQVAVFALRNYGGYPILQMFYKTSPLLVFPLSYYLFEVLINNNNNKLVLKLIILLSIVLTLFLSGTRANIVSLTLIILFYLGYFFYKKSKILFAILVGFYILLAAFGISAIGGFLLNPKEVSNLVKFEYILSYTEHFSDHPGELLFGQGLGGVFYSSGMDKILDWTELTYFELIRIWGFPITIVFIIVLMLPIFDQIRSRNIDHFFISYLAYLFIAGTNPLLLNSTGMIVLVYVFSNTMHRKTKIIKENSIIPRV